MAYKISEKDIALANSADIVSFLKTQGVEAKRVGRTYEWESPTGKVSIQANRWYSQYERVGGYSVNFAMKYFGMKFAEAVNALTGRSVETVTINYSNEKRTTKKAFVVPVKNEGMNRAYAYLKSKRGIDDKIIKVFANKGLIFEDYPYHNVVFVGKDENGNVKHIHKRSTIVNSSYKGNAEASDPENSFNWRGESNRLFVFEAPIDMLSYITMHQKGWNKHSYVALCSTAGLAALKMIKDNPDIDTIYLCLDNDNAGDVGCQKIAEQIHSVGEYDIWRLFPQQKDWNEDLQSLKNKNNISDSSDATESENEEIITIGEI